MTDPKRTGSLKNNLYSGGFMKRAFTLIELIIVIAVIGVLAAILIPIIVSSVEKANAASALSDAANLHIEYEAIVKREGSYSASSIICISKGGKMYVYGAFTGRTNLYESTHNPYNVRASGQTQLSDFVDTLVHDGDVYAVTDELQQNASSSFSNAGENAAVFFGYGLNSFVTDLYISEDIIELAPGETHELKCVISPEADISYESSDTSIAQVDENGTVTAIAEGRAKITASCGDMTAEATVNVYDYIEFYGNLEQLKAYFEQTGKQTLFIRLMTGISFEYTASTDSELYHITIPENKHIRLDLNGHSINCHTLPELDEEAFDYFIANFGLFEVEGSTGTGNLSMSIQGQSHQNIQSGYAMVLNYSVMEVKGNAALHAYFLNNNSGEAYAIKNFGQLTYTNVSHIIGSIHGYTICNEEGGHLNIIRTQGDESISVKNYGVIENIQDSTLAGYLYKPGLVNCGTILKIGNCEFSKDNSAITDDPINYEDSPTIPFDAWTTVENRGRIGEIINCRFEPKGASHAFSAISGSIGKIQNCTFIGKNGEHTTYLGFNATSDFSLDTPLTDGAYSNSIDARFIADGYRCAEQGGVYKIVRA